MKWLVLVLVLIAGSANAQVFKPRSKLLMKKVDLKTPAATTPVKAVTTPTPAVVAKKTPTKSSRVARPDEAPPKKKKTAKKKHKTADDDDDVKVSDDDDDVKVSDD
jgi:hypothetical protein